MKALAVFFDHLERAGERKGKLKIRASAHLAEVYGGFEVREGSLGSVVGNANNRDLNANGTGDMNVNMHGNLNGSGNENTQGQGWRYATEAVGFLRKRGAKIPSVSAGVGLGMNGLEEDDEWALGASGSDMDTDELKAER